MPTALRFRIRTPILTALEVCLVARPAHRPSVPWVAGDCLLSDRDRDPRSCWLWCPLKLADSPQVHQQGSEKHQGFLQRGQAQGRSPQVTGIATNVADGSEPRARHTRRRERTPSKVRRPTIARIQGTRSNPRRRVGLEGNRALVLRTLPEGGSLLASSGGLLQPTTRMAERSCRGPDRRSSLNPSWGILATKADVLLLWQP